MRRCIRCSSAIEGGAGWTCAQCGFEPQRRRGIPVFAPDLADSEADYEARFFAQLFDAEPRSFWFRSRNALIARMLRSIEPRPQTIMEIGCGTGFVLERVAKLNPTAAITATDVLPEAFDYARRRVPTADFIQVDITQLPFSAEFDLICAFDVLEHVDDDRRAMREIHRALRPGGWLLLTVPQHPALWSASDVIAHHKRRYTRTDLTSKLHDAAFKIVRVTSFVTLLAPLLFLARKRVKTCEDAVADLLLPKFLDMTLSAVMTVERVLISAGLSLPFGGSLLVFARRA